MSDNPSDFYIPQYYAFEIFSLYFSGFSHCHELLLQVHQSAGVSLITNVPTQILFYLLHLCNRISMPTVTFLFISDSSFEHETPKWDVLRLRTLKELQIASLKVVIDYHEMCGQSINFIEFIKT